MGVIRDKTRWLLAASMFAAVTLAVEAFGHHSTSAIFDESRVIEVRAVMREVRWINPHIFVGLAPADGEGEGWTFESQPPQWYRRVGIGRSTFEAAIGTEVTIRGWPARQGQAFGFLLGITFADGTSFSVVDDPVE